MIIESPQYDDIDLSSLFGHRIEIDQAPLPITEAGKALDRADNDILAKIHAIDYSQGKNPWIGKGFTFGKGKKLPPRTSDDD